MVDGLPRDDQPLGDLRVAKPLGQERQDFELAGGQAGRILACPGPWSAGQLALAERTHRDG